MTAETSSRGGGTREEIIRSAHQLFMLRGYHGASMRQIAQQAGLAVGGIYNHFSNKEDIFLAVLMRHHPYFDVLPAMEAAQGETIEEFVRDAARRMVGELGERKEFLNLIFIELVEFEGQHIPRLFETFFPGVMAFAQRFLETRGELRPIPLPIIVRAFIGLFFSFILTEILIARQLPPEMQENALDYFVDIFLNGILANE